jgi:hypothetical protein
MDLVNRQAHLDPDFGNICPEKVDAYRVDVESSGRRWFFILMTPEHEDIDDELDTVEICKRFLDEEDHVKIFTFCMADMETLAPNTPIISFDPDYEDDFFWLLPPQWLKH